MMHYDYKPLTDLLDLLVRFKVIHSYFHFSTGEFVVHISGSDYVLPDSANYTLKYVVTSVNGVSV